MKVKDFNEGVHCVEYALMNLTREDEKLFEVQFNYLEDFKNDFIRFMHSKIESIRKENKEFDNAMDEVEFLNKNEGKIVNKDERSDRLNEAYRIIKDTISKEKLLNSHARQTEFRTILDPIYRIWLPDDVRSYACDNVITAFKTFFFSKGKSVITKPYGHTCSMQYKPMYAKSKEDGSIGTKVQTSCRIEFDNGLPVLTMWDLRDSSMRPLLDEYDAETKTIKKDRNHKYRTFNLYCDENNKLQKYILDNPYLGATKLIRYWKKGKWRYRIQVNFEKVSPAVEEIQNEHYKMGIDFGTETVAIVRDDGYQEIIELSPNTPRVTESIKELDRYMDNSKRATNPHLYNEDGTLKYNKQEMKNLGLRYNYSKRYLKAKSKRKEEYRLLREHRKLNNLKDAKYIFSLADEFYTENNSFAGWGTKRCRMSKKAKSKYDNGIRKNDYTKQIHDRAVGSIDARLEHLSKQKGITYNKIKGKSDFNCSTYNHFTDSNDLFTTLNNRLVVFDTSTVGDRYKDVSSEFKETFNRVKVGKRYYILQRDLYSAAKMLYYLPYTEKVMNKNNKEVEVVKYKFDKEGFQEFFDNIFYPKHEEYIMKLRKEDKILNGTIFGGI